MKTIQVTYTTNKGTWLADMNLKSRDISKTENGKLLLVSKIYGVLCERYGDILDWRITKEYN